MNTQHLLLNLNVFESDILKIKEGQNIEFTIPQASKDVYKSKVKTVGKSIENKDRSISVFGLLQPELKEKLLSGMFVEANIITDAKKGFGVPSDAIITENDKHYVLVLNSKTSDYKFKKVAVTVGEKSEKFIEIMSDDNVNTETKLLTKGVFELTN